MENWKQIKETDIKQYYVSDLGRVKTINNGKEKLLKIGKKTNGYRNVRVDGKTQYVHRLVAEAFIPNPENKPTVNHKRGLDAGDGVDNLEWMTYKEQQEHALETGLRTDGKTPAIVLDTNGEIVSKHDTITNAMGSYDGKEIYHSKDVKIKGNVIVMKQVVYDELSDSEVFAIVSDCLNLVMNNWYVVDGQLYESGAESAELLNRNKSTMLYRSKGNRIAVINGHVVSRVSERIGVFNDE